MKTSKFVLSTILFCVLIFSSCNKDVLPKENNSFADIAITEDTFIEQIEYIRFVNPTEHLGKTIILEGLYTFESGPPYVSLHESGLIVFSSSREIGHQFVGRRLNHEYDFEGWVGFIVLWDGERPDNYSWVEAVGVLEFKEPTESTFGGYMLNLISLTVLEDRGLETLSRQ